MSAWSDIRQGIRKAILMEERIERLSTQVGRLEDRFIDHERRLVRIETMIDLARKPRQIP